MKKQQFTCDCEVIHEAVVERVRSHMPEAEDFYMLSSFYKLMADNTRVKILWALSCESMCVCDLAVLLDMTKSAISHQLKTLRLAGFVKFEKRGKEVYYTLSDQRVVSAFQITA
jgi:ArsR family transcriptional regulator